MATTETDVSTENGKRLPDALRHPISSLQERFETLETEARGRLRRAIDTGNEKLRVLDEALARVSSDDFSVPKMRRHLDDLRARAETLRATALKRVAGMPGNAVSAIATQTRAPIQNLARGLAGFAKRLDQPADSKAEPAKSTDS
jgi:hypothetical protein